MSDDPDLPVRLAAFAALARPIIANAGRLAWRNIDAGFPFRDDKVHFANRARGIFKQRQMTAALSAEDNRTADRASVLVAGPGGES